MSIDIFPTLHFLARPGLTPGLLTVTRSGTATRVGPRGHVEAVAEDTLRHDFAADTGVYRGWLVEEARTNLLLQSRDVTAAAWQKSNMSVARDALGMDGVAATACTLTAGLAGTTVHQSVTAANATYTLSVDLRRVSGAGAVFLTLDGGATWTPVTGLQAGRFGRFAITQTLANPTPGLRLDAAADAVACDYWQLEAGGFATSRIPTTTAPATRGADALRIDPAQPWFNPREGTVYVDAVPGSGSNNKTLIGSSDTPRAVELSVIEPAAGLTTNLGAIGSAFTGGSPSGRPIASGQAVRAALAYGPDGGAVAHDGVIFQRFATGTAWETTGMAIGHQLRGGAQRFLNGHVRHVAVFPRRLGDGAITDLTVF